jgi:hypothetical protein
MRLGSVVRGWTAPCAAKVNSGKSYHQLFVSIDVRLRTSRNGSICMTETPVIFFSDTITNQGLYSVSSKHMR